MRISQQQLVANSLERMRKRLGEYERVQTQLGSGKVIQKPSDDAGRMNTILALRSTHRSREQEARNAQDGATWVGLTDTKLQEASEALRRARDLIVAAGNPMRPEERSAAAAELRAISEELAAIANSKHHDQSVFGGFADGSAVTQVAGVWTFTGDAGKVTRRISDYEVVTVNLSANEVFGFAAGDNVFDRLTSIAADIEADVPNAASVALADVDAAADRIYLGLAQVGATGNRIERALTRNSSETLTIKGELSHIQDTDLAEAVMELQLQEVAYQATLAALAKSLQPSLVDFLR
jgi:flagellar hook-associated protein 3 FlgL